MTAEGGGKLSTRRSSMFVTENDLRRIVNKEISPELAERRAKTLERSKGALAHLVPGVMVKGVIVPPEEPDKK